MVNGLNWQCCFAGSSKTAPRILVFSIAMGDDYSFEMNSIETWAPTFFEHRYLFLGSVLTETCYCIQLYGNCRIMWIGKSLLFIPSFKLIIDHCVVHWAVIAFLFDFSASRKKVSFLITKWALGTIFTLRYLQTPLPWQPELFPLVNGVKKNCMYTKDGLKGDPKHTQFWISRLQFATSNLGEGSLRI